MTKKQVFEDGDHYKLTYEMCREDGFSEKDARNWARIAQRCWGDSAKVSKAHKENQMAHEEREGLPVDPEVFKQFLADLGGIGKFQAFMHLSNSGNGFDVEIFLEDCSYKEVRSPGNDRLVLFIKNHPAKGESHSKIVGMRLVGIQKIIS